jgi:hypothetical protein
MGGIGIPLVYPQRNRASNKLGSVSSYRGRCVTSTWASVLSKYLIKFVKQGSVRATKMCVTSNASCKLHGLMGREDTVNEHI